MKLPQAIPHVQNVKDPELRQILEALRSGLMALADGTLGKEEARQLGMMGKSIEGKWYARQVRDRASGVEQVADLAAPEVGTSVLISAEFNAAGGLAVGSHNIEGLSLPENAIVTLAWYDVLDAFTSGGAATIAFSIPTDDAEGIKAATAIGSGFTLGQHACIQTGSVANFSEKTTAERIIQADVGTDALTAGLLRLFVQYSVSG